MRDRWDVSQDVFLAAYQSFDSYNPLRARPERWLNMICVHVAAHYWDRAWHRREVSTPDEQLNIMDESLGPDEKIQSAQEQILVSELMEQMAPELRAILKAHDIEGTPIEKIAEQLGMPMSTAYKWHARALAALTCLMKRRARSGRS